VIRRAAQVDADTVNKVMASATSTVDIDRPPSAVFRFLADGLNNSHWRPSVASVSLKSGNAGAAGAVYQQTLRGPFGLKLAADYRIVSAKPDAVIEFAVVAGPARPSGIFTLMRIGDGTRLTFSLDLETRGLLRLFDRLIELSMLHEVRNLPRLKAALEAQA
jgi:hypothetical protein